MDKWKIIFKGEWSTINEAQLNYDLESDYRYKNIEIAVREVKNGNTLSQM